MSLAPSNAAHQPPSRSQLRYYPLDGAALWFQPSTGLHLRAHGEAFAHLRRVAPRAVMFGITNACNLRCAFCSRDAQRASKWSVASAAAVLRGLAEAGTLEVAFGGGEPLRFPGFAELIAELHATTPLALHVTTNGSLLSRALPALRGYLAEVRLSIYDEEPWQRAAAELAASGQRWGANLLLDEPRLARLPELYAELAAFGCRDVALLPFIGVPERMLGPTARARLAALLPDAALPSKVSVCFGSALAVAHLPRALDVADADDCGAGLDFLTLTPDRRLQSCSFFDEAWPTADEPELSSAEQVLQLWHARRAQLATAARRSGCARRLPRARAASWPERALWHGYAGNNSGECVMVGKFESGEAAARYVAELSATLAPDQPYSPAWQELFAAEQVAAMVEPGSYPPERQSPTCLLAVGRSVIATSYDSDDPFPELRALTWKRGGYVVAGGLHLHHDPDLLAAIRGKDEDDVRALEHALLAACREAAAGASAEPPAGRNAAAMVELRRREDHVASLRVRTQRHGSYLLAHLPCRGRTDEELAAHLERLRATAGARPLAAEPLLQAVTDEQLTTALQRLGTELATTPRLWLAFWGEHAAARARRYEQSLADPTVRAFGSGVLVEGVARRKRLAVLGLRHGAEVNALEGTSVRVSLSWWHLPVDSGKRKPSQPHVDRAALTRAMAARAQPLAIEEQGRGGAHAALETARPGDVLEAAGRAAAELGCEHRAYLGELDPLAHCLRRLLAEL